MRTPGIAVAAILLAAVTSFLPGSTDARQNNASPKHATSRQQEGNLPSSTYKQQLILVEDLAADVNTDSGTITITAKITNVSRAFIKGYATVHLLSEEGKPLLSYEEDLNGGEMFAHGTSVDLELTAKVRDISKIASITVDFTQT